MGLYSVPLLCAKFDHSFTHSHNVITWYVGSSHRSSLLAEMISYESVCYDLRMCFAYVTVIKVPVKAIIYIYIYIYIIQFSRRALIKVISLSDHVQHFYSLLCVRVIHRYFLSQVLYSSS